jgi:transglutaminase-like putative cysteine protease
MTTVLQVSLYGLVMLGGGMLAFAEGSSFPDAFTIPLAILALFVTERWKLFWLPVRWANALGIGAFVLAGWEMSSGQIEARLLSLAHLLVYLTWIVLFLSKTARMYWTMCLLAVLHVAVGAVLTSTGAFGALCGIFLVIAVWTLTLFTLNRARERYATEDQMLFATNRTTSASRRSDQSSEVTFLWNQNSQPVSTIQIDPRLQWISGAFASGVLANVVLSALVGALFFMFTPRIWVGSFSAFGEGPDQPLRILQSGFAEEVQLGDIGQILEGTQTVLEVRMFDQMTDQPLDIAEHASRLGFDEPLFRGSVLGEYEKGKWRVGTTGRNDNLRAVPSSPATGDTIRQEFRVEPMDSGILFAMPQHVAGRLDHRYSQLIERRLTATLHRSDSITGRETLKYTIYSDRPRPGGDLPFPRGTHPTLTLRNEVEYYSVLPERGLERLQTLARQIAQPPNATSSTPTEMAQRLVHYLRDSGEFGYTLDLSIQDSKIDAVEDFLFNRKAGHCEYFASALALMLRAVEIPARLVSGFKGGDVKPSTGYFVVQGRHAHVWVEAYFDGHWRVLDATPASRSDSVKSLAPKTGLFSSLANLFADTWSHSVVGLSFSEQTTNFYAPLKEFAEQTWGTIQEDFRDAMNGDFMSADRAGPRRFVLGSLLGLVLLSTLSWKLLAARSSSAASSGGGWFARLRIFLNWLLPREVATSNGDGWRNRWSRWWAALIRLLRGESAEQYLRVEFYERFLRLLRSAGLEPLPTQTAREFIVASQPIWSQRLSGNELASVPAEIVSRFYRVRFGAESLPLEELRQLDSQLRQLEQDWHRNNVQNDRNRAR